MSKLETSVEKIEKAWDEDSYKKGYSDALADISKRLDDIVIHTENKGVGVDDYFEGAMAFKQCIITAFRQMGGKY